MFFSTKPIPNYNNSTIETQCYGKSDAEVLKWLNCTTAWISRLTNCPDPSKDPRSALAQLQEKEDRLRTVCIRRGMISDEKSSTGTTVTTSNSAKRKLPLLTSSPVKKRCVRKMISIGTQTEPWICPDCNGNPDLEEEKFVFNPYAADDLI